MRLYTLVPWYVGFLLRCYTYTVPDAVMDETVCYVDRVTSNVRLGF